MKKQQYIVFGLNRFGTSVARTLAAAGNEVVAVDQDADRVAQIADDVSYAVQVDVADEDAMSGLGNGAYGWCSHCCCQQHGSKHCDCNEM